MNSPIRQILLTVIALVVGFWALKVVLHAALVLIFQVAVPVLVVGGLAYGAYRLFGPKALGSGRRMLP